MIKDCKFLANGPLFSTSESAQAELTLTHRLRQVLARLECGLSEKQCAIELKLSHHTIHGYVKMIYKKFGVHSRSQLLAARFEGRSYERMRDTPYLG
jgi:DNA-binding NarL/FixJ family response regulator